METLIVLVIAYFLFFKEGIKEQKKTKTTFKRKRAATNGLLVYAYCSFISWRC